MASSIKEQPRPQTSTDSSWGHLAQLPRHDIEGYQCKTLVLPPPILADPKSANLQLLYSLRSKFLGFKSLCQISRM